jgi:asparagine synthase (glutamine-hydrolysing)
MCGICGYIYLDNDRFEADSILNMVAVLKHRGPDASGLWTNQEHGTAIGHTRLKIIDLTNKASQPMTNSSNDLVVTYNGEIYNFADERRKLEKLGYKFNSKSDTEVVLNLYAHYGDSFVNSLNGDFALAIWDSNKRRLLLCRDRIGVKPLYFTMQKGVFIFASEIKSILKHALISPELDMDSMQEFFSNLFIPGERTMFKDIFELQPGFQLTYENGIATRKQYYNFRFDQGVRGAPHEEQKREFERLFIESLNSRLISDVPLGVYLSGGIDSSYMTVKLSENHSDIHTYSLGFKDKELNEFEYSDAVAKLARTKHIRFLTSEKNFPDIVDKVIWHFDEPPPQMVSVPQYHLARKAKQQISVALLGSGGDELLAGYSHYLSALNCLEHKGIFAKDEYQKNLPPHFIASEFKTCNQKPILDKILINKRDSRENVAKYYLENDYPDFLSKMLYMDFKTHLVSMMNKDDKMNMAFGVEGRFPYLDHRLVNYCLSMSPELKIKNGIGKHILKKLCRRYFSKNFVYREKQAFPTPVDVWIRDNPLEWKKSKIADMGLFNMKNLKILAKNPEILCKTGNGPRRMWSVYVLEKWLQIFF